MDLLKCACGCDKLNKEELEKMINSTNRVQDFLNNTQCVEMFENMLHKKPTGKACNNLMYLKMAKGFLENPSQLANEDGSPRTFTGMIDEELSEKLLDCTDDAGRESVLHEIIKEYSLRLSLSDEYKAFQQQLKKAYQGKQPIRKSD